MNAITLFIILSALIFAVLGLGAAYLNMKDSVLDEDGGEDQNNS